MVLRLRVTMLLTIGLLAGSVVSIAIESGAAKAPPATSKDKKELDAHSAPSLTLEEVLSSVDAHFPLVIAALRDYEKAKGELLSSQGGFDPVVKSMYQAVPSGEYQNRYFDTVIEQPTSLWGTKLFSGYRNGQGSFAPYDGRMLTDSDGEVRAGVEIPLLRGGSTDERRAKIESSRQALEVASLSVRLNRIDAKRQASYRYFEWVAAAEKLKIAEELLKFALDRDEAIGHRVVRGDAARVEQADNQRSVVQRQAALVSATRAFEKAQLELSLFYRSDEGEPLQGSLKQVPRDVFQAPPSSSKLDKSEARFKDANEASLEVLTQHPEILRIQAQLAQNEVEQKLARNSILPRLDAEFAAAKDLGPASSPKSQVEYKAALKLEIPLFLRTGQGRSEAASAQKLKLDSQLNLARDRIRVAISDAFQALEASEKRILLSQNEVDLSLKVEQAERVKFKVGDSNILIVNLREQATADARSKRIDALFDFYRAKVDLAAATARTE